MSWLLRRVRLAPVVACLLVAAAAPGCGRSPSAPTPPMVPGPPAGPSPAPPAPTPVVPRLAVERILAFGDSLTEGESTGTVMRLAHDPGTPGVSSSYPFKLQGLLAARYTGQTIQVFNGGRGGERATEGLDRMTQLLRDLAPQVMILMTGVNDLNGGVAIPLVIDAVEDMIRDARARGVDVLLSTIPRQVPGGRRADSVELVEPYNAELAALALDENVPLVDVHPHLTEPFITPDGLHITEAGNAVLAGLYFDALKARYETAGPVVSRRR